DRKARHRILAPRWLRGVTARPGARRTGRQRPRPGVDSLRPGLGRQFARSFPPVGSALKTLLMALFLGNAKSPPIRARPEHFFTRLRAGLRGSTLGIHFCLIAQARWFSYVVHFVRDRLDRPSEGWRSSCGAEAVGALLQAAGRPGPSQAARE